MTQDTMTRHTDAGLVASPLMATATGMFAEGLVRVAFAVGGAYVADVSRPEDRAARQAAVQVPLSLVSGSNFASFSFNGLSVRPPQNLWFER